MFGGVDSVCTQKAFAKLPDGLRAMGTETLKAIGKPGDGSPSCTPSATRRTSPTYGSWRFLNACGHLIHREASGAQGIPHFHQHAQSGIGIGFQLQFGSRLLRLQTL